MRRRTCKHKGRTITRLPTGRYQVRIKDSAGKPYRPSFPDLKEAKAAVVQFLAKEARGERFLASAAHTTFSEGMDLSRKRAVDNGLSRSRLDAIDGVRRNHLEPEFGHRKLSEFVDERMTFVKEWLQKKKEEGYAQDTMSQMLSDIKLAFAAAISEGKMAPPNPVVAFDVSAPHVERKKRQTLPIDHMIAWMRGARERGRREKALPSETRFCMSILGFSLPLRDEDLCGLCWDCIDLDARVAYLYRVVMNVHGDQRWALVDTTKTGEEGKGRCRISPPAHAMLIAWRDRMRDLEV